MKGRITIMLVIVGLGCAAEKSMEDERLELQAQKSVIAELANSGNCVDDAECKLMGLGSKPCGGPWSWLVYSTSMDVAQLATMVNSYNAAEETFNHKWGMGSDCSIAVRPDSLKCLVGKCVAYYKGEAHTN